MALPLASLLCEASIGGLYVLGGDRVAWIVASAFHLPLTLIMAPAFAFVMLAGHISFLEPEDLEALASALAGGGRRCWPWPARCAR